MIKKANISQLNQVRLPDTFRPSVSDTNKDGTTTVDIYFGSNMDIVVVVAKGKKLSEDNQKRIKILTEERG